MFSLGNINGEVTDAMPNLGEQQTLIFFCSFFNQPATERSMAFEKGPIQIPASNSGL